MTRLAGLLRAVNLGERKLLMEDLKRVALSIGLDRPETLLASGNVLFETTLSKAEAGARLHAALHAQLGLASDVLVRDAQDLAAVIADNPFESEAREAPSKLAIMFLDSAPVGSLDSLTSACTLGEQVRASPQCLYAWYPQGLGVSKLTNGLIERRLQVRGSMRNWNTVNKLVERLSA